MVTTRQPAGEFSTGAHVTGESERGKQSFLAVRVIRLVLFLSRSGPSSSSNNTFPFRTVAEGQIERLNNQYSVSAAFVNGKSIIELLRLDDCELKLIPSQTEFNGLQVNSFALKIQFVASQDPGPSRVIKQRLTSVKRPLQTYRYAQ